MREDKGVWATLGTVRKSKAVKLPPPPNERALSSPALSSAVASPAFIATGRASAIVTQSRRQAVDFSCVSIRLSHDVGVLTPLALLRSWPRSRHALRPPSCAMCVCMCEC